MFRFTRKQSSESHSQYLEKVPHLVQSGYVQPIQDVVSDMAAYYVHCVRVYCMPSHNAQFTSLTGHNMQP